MRLRDVGLTALLWFGFLYLSSDLFLFLAESFFWMIGMGPESPRLHMVLDVLPTVGTYAMVAVANATVLILWALYNQVRFRGKERRKASPIVTVDDFARMYEVSAAEVTAWQSARILVVHHDENGRLVQVDLPEESHSSDELAAGRR
jgi:biofilm PGA synthesis protein PgaD